MSVKLSKRSVVLMALWFALFKIEAISQNMYYGITIVLLLLISPIVIGDIVKKRKNNIFLSSFLVATVISTYLFFGVSNHLLRGIVFAYSIYSAWIVVNRYIAECGYDYVFRIFYRISIFYIVVTYIFMLINPSTTTYFVGSKFKVVYLHAFFVMLWYALNFEKLRSVNKRFIKEIIFLFLILWGCFISLAVDCTTGIIAMLLFYALMHAPQKMTSVFQRPAIVVSVFFLVNFLFVGSSIIMSSGWFNTIVSSVFHETATLRGRVFIYDQIRQIISQKPIWGYGYESTIVYTQIGYGNAQNGLLKLLVDFGLVGTILFIVYLWRIKTNEQLSQHQAWSMWAFIYMMIACSLFEVSINSFFYLVLILLSSSSYPERNRTEVTMLLNHK